MKQIILGLFSLSFIFFISCEEQLSPIYDGSFLQMSEGGNLSILRVDDGAGVPAGISISLVGAQQSSPVNYSFEIAEASTAIAGTHYELLSNSGTIPANTNQAVLPINILDDNINPGESYTMIVNITSADVDLNDNYNNSTFNIGVSCPSNLAGGYTATATGTNQSAGIGWDDCGSSWSGELIIQEAGSGVYDILTEGPAGDFWVDASLGAYYACYGTDAEGSLPGGNVQITDVCGQLAFIGQSQWGETFSFADVAVSGNDLTLTWVNDYGEGAVVVITSDNGWPDGLRN